MEMLVSTDQSWKKSSPVMKRADPEFGVQEERSLYKMGKDMNKLGENEKKRVTAFDNKNPRSARYLASLATLLQQRLGSDTEDKMSGSCANMTRPLPPWRS